MRIYHKIPELKEYIAFQKAKWRSVGLVPTMGFLHEGHVSLIEKSASENDLTVVSIFVNPTQFGPNEDYETYPRDFEADSQAARNAGADILFAPPPDEMYPDGYGTYVYVEGLSDLLCGKSRPDHFRGVASVVCKLFNIVTPDRAYFGQKDAQQLVIIGKMARDLNMGVKIIGCPIIREEDGLAKSSRNTYLSSDERKRAAALCRSLYRAQEMVQAGQRNAGIIHDAMIQTLKEASPDLIDYVEIVNADTLQPVELLAGRVLIALAVRFGQTRLIDNIVLEV